ncbi:MAG: superoxide dismutase [Gammaproteobacteria bacterium]|nr:superoxide dismutase [Gammaproteobacteria bacterium]
MKFELPSLPYAQDALAPHISANTLDFHYGKHHQTYMTNLANALKDSADASKSLEEIVRSSSGGNFNNAAQVWNHSFYWHSMSPKGGGAPSGDLAAAIDRDCGGLDKLKEALATAGATQFGSGWAWLVTDPSGKLSVTKTGNAETPITDANQIPLLTIDVWEHAYYLDFQNRRPAYLSTFLDSLANWSFAAENYANRGSGARKFADM